MMNSKINRAENQDTDVLNLKEETTDEKFLKIKISEVEERNLKKVFKVLCGRRNYKENELRWFDSSDIRRVLKVLGVKYIP